MAEIEKDEFELDETVDTFTEEELEETETTETEETEEIPEEQETVEEIRECKGLFIRIPASEFTQNERYSDRYLKSKGLFKED